jgi:hypothetical protein
MRLTIVSGNVVYSIIKQAGDAILRDFPTPSPPQIGRIAKSIRLPYPHNVVSS